MTYKQRYLEMAETAERMAQQLAQQAAVIEQMREALQVAERNNPDKVLVTVFSKALALQPCPEVLNKARAEAVRKAFKLMMDGRWRGDALDVLADRMERGEA